MRTFDYDMLTEKERKTYEFILKYHKKYAKYPLLIDIAKGIGIKSKGVAHRYVIALEKANKLKEFLIDTEGYLWMKKNLFF